MRIRSLGVLVVYMLLLLPLQVSTPTTAQPEIDLADSENDWMASADDVLESSVVQQARALFRQLDVNGDGQLDPAEMPTNLRTQLSRWDANKDGTIDAAEFLLYFTARVKQARIDARDLPRPQQIRRPAPSLLPIDFGRDAEIREDQNQQDQQANPPVSRSVKDKLLPRLERWLATERPVAEFWDVVDLIPGLFSPDKPLPAVSRDEDNGSNLSAPAGGNAGGKEVNARTRTPQLTPDDWEAQHVAATAGLQERRGQAAPLSRAAAVLSQGRGALEPLALAELEPEEPTPVDPDSLDAFATVPLPLDDGANLAWMLRNEQNLEFLKDGPANVVFLGDSITDYLLTGLAQPVWDSTFAPLGAINLGVRGITTSEVLWQVETGQVAAAQPQVVVLMIGINNLLYGQSTEATAAGISRIVEQISEQLPNTQILLLGLLPVGEDPNPLREGVADINSMIANLASERVNYQDIGQWFTEPDGTISSAILADYIHPSVLGYELYASLIAPIIQDMLAGKTGSPDTAGAAGQ